VPPHRALDSASNRDDRTSDIGRKEGVRTKMERGVLDMKGDPKDRCLVLYLDFER